MLRKFGVCGPNELGDNYPQLVQSQKISSPTNAGTEHLEPSTHDHHIDDSTATHLVDDSSHSPVGASEDAETDSLRADVETRNLTETEAVATRNGASTTVSKSVADSVTFNSDCTPVSTSNQTGTGILTSGKKTLAVAPLSGAAAPNASATATAAVSAAAIASAFLSGDEDEVEDVAQLEARIETLNQVVEYKQRAIEECSYRLSGLFLGQDRFYRRYYIFGHLGGIYIQGHAVKEKSLGSVTSDLPLPNDSDEQNMNSVQEKDTDVGEGCEEGQIRLPSRKQSKSEEYNTDLLMDYALDDDEDARLGFDPDQIVALIRAHHELADARRYKINLPSGGVHGSSSSSTNTVHTQHHGQAVQSQMASSGSTQQSITLKQPDALTVVATEQLSDSTQSPKIGSSLDLSEQSVALISECPTEKPLSSYGEASLEKVDTAAPHLLPSPILISKTPDLQLEEPHFGPKSQSVQNDVSSGALVRFVSEMDSNEMSEFNTVNTLISPEEIINDSDPSTNIKALGIEKLVDETVEGSTNGGAGEIDASGHDTKNNSQVTTEQSCQFPHAPIDEAHSDRLSQQSDEVKEHISEIKPILSGVGERECDSKIALESKSVEKQENSCAVDQISVGDHSHPRLFWKCEDFLDGVHEDAINLDVKTNRICDDSPVRVDPIGEGLRHSRKETGTGAQPLDLSTKSVLDLPETVGPLKSTSFPETPEASFAFITSLGLDDVALTTAALLFMTHTSIIPATVACSDTLFEPWKSIIAHYKSILIWALMEDLRTDSANNSSGNTLNSSLQPKLSGNDDSGDISGLEELGTLRDAMLLLKKSFVGELKHDSPSENSDSLEEFPQPISEWEVEDLVNQELQSRRIQSKHPQTATVQVAAGLEKGDETKPATGWYRLVDPGKLHELIHALASRGLRERNLAKALKRSDDLVEPSLKVAADAGESLYKHAIFQFYSNFTGILFCGVSDA